MLKTSIVIVTWNSQEVISTCLSSVSQGLTAFSSEMIVVDNGSHDQTPAIVREQFPGARLICNCANRGVAPARNQGLRIARGEYVILLDDDTVVQPGAFDGLIAYLDASPAVGVCGPKLVDEQGDLHLSCRLFPTFGDKLARRLPSRAAQRIAGAAELADWDHQSVRGVDYVIGACQAIRQTALSEVGLLDERIFYGPEDVDLCLRMRQAGWQVVYYPEATVIHTERRVTRSLFSRLTWRHGWGLGYFFWKHGYLFSRRRLYARLSPGSAAHPKAASVSGQTSLHGARAEGD